MVLTNSDFESVMRLFPDLKLHVLGFQREQMDKYKTESRKLLQAQGNKGNCKPSGHTMQGAMSVATGGSAPGSFRKDKSRNNTSSPAVRFQEPGQPSSQSSPDQSPGGGSDALDEVEEFQKEEDSPR